MYAKLFHTTTAGKDRADRLLGNKIWISLDHAFLMPARHLTPKKPTEAVHNLARHNRTNTEYRTYVVTQNTTVRFSKNNPDAVKPKASSVVDTTFIFGSMHHYQTRNSSLGQMRIISTAIS